jgi:F0F1-type ATP synthase delta subunit
MPDYKLKELPKQISNLSQIYQIISFIDDAISEKRSIEAANKAGVKSQIDKIELPEIMQYFFEDSIEWGHLNDLKHELERIISLAPTVTLTLSGIPSNKFKNKIVGWLRAINPFVLVEILVDISIIGGVIVKTDKKRIDLTISTLFLENKESLKGILNNV